jgi:hypothetical protein
MFNKRKNYLIIYKYIKMSIQKLVSYRRMLKLAGRLKNYNYREYFLRKIQHDFRTIQNFELYDYNNRYAELERIINVQNLYANMNL